MTSYTQRFAAFVMAPWLERPQTQFATFTFDDATPAQFPTFATIREELARRSAFKDTDATTTGDTWNTSPPVNFPKALEIDRLDVQYLFELNDAVAFQGVAPANLARDPATGLPSDDYVWPAVGDGTAADLGGLAVFTIAGDDYLTTNIADADDTPPVVASVTVASPGDIAVGDRLIITLNGVVAFDQAFAEVSTNYQVTGDLATSGAGTHQLNAFIVKADGRSSRSLARTFTNS